MAHNGSLVPVPGRDIEVQAWYQGGVSVMDFTDAAHPNEIAYFDRGPIDPKTLVLGGDWSAYWYNGDDLRIGDRARAGRVRADADEVSDAERDRCGEGGAGSRAERAEPAEDRVAAQLVVAKAYLDQLTRSQALPQKQIASLKKAIASAEKSHLKAKDVAKLAKMAPGVESRAGSADPVDAARLHGLAAILEKPVA